MTFVQIIIIILSVLFLFRTFINFKKQRISPKTFLFWAGLWVILIVLVSLPPNINPLLIMLGAGRGIDVAVYFSILLVFFLIYKIGVRLEKIEHEITEIVRKEALKK